MFNKISQWTERESEGSEAKKILDFLAGEVCEWVYSEDMTEEEKENHPKYKITGGYLKQRPMWEKAVSKWVELTDDQKSIVMSIPNFDKDIFKEITGIDVEEDKNGYI